jgi:hypothetical protein
MILKCLDYMAPYVNYVSVNQQIIDYQPLLLITVFIFNGLDVNWHLKGHVLNIIFQISTCSDDLSISIVQVTDVR